MPDHSAWAAAIARMTDAELDAELAAEGVDVAALLRDVARITNPKGNRPMKELHPNVTALLAFFVYDHLPLRLQDISRPFSEIANAMAIELDGPELTVGLRKLLEAKDCMVRAALPK